MKVIWKKTTTLGDLIYMLNYCSCKKIEDYLVSGKRVHLVGIGGVSMCPLGLVLKGMGMIVTGSDMNSSVSTDELIGKGISVAIGHRAENIQGADCIIRTAAAHNDNPEFAAANDGCQPQCGVDDHCNTDQPDRGFNNGDGTGNDIHTDRRTCRAEEQSDPPEGIDTTQHEIIVHAGGGACQQPCTEEDRNQEFQQRRDDAEQCTCDHEHDTVNADDMRLASLDQIIDQDAHTAECQQSTDNDADQLQNIGLCREQDT